MKTIRTGNFTCLKSWQCLTVYLILPIVLLAGCGVRMVPKTQQKKFSTGELIYVYPVHILKRNSSFDSVYAKKIVDCINEHEGMRAVFVNRTPLVNSTWHMNEARMFKESFDAFSTFIQDDLPSDASYALLVEFLILPYELDLHYYLVEKKSRKAVMLNLINSHHDLYKEVNPKTPDDGVVLFDKVFSENLRHLKELK
jgi:hypothetical protein